MVTVPTGKLHAVFAELMAQRRRHNSLAEGFRFEDTTQHTRSAWLPRNYVGAMAELACLEYVATRFRSFEWWRYVNLFPGPDERAEGDIGNWDVKANGPDLKIPPRCPFGHIYVLAEVEHGSVDLVGWHHYDEEVKGRHWAAWMPDPCTLIPRSCLRPMSEAAEPKPWPAGAYAPLVAS